MGGTLTDLNPIESQYQGSKQQARQAQENARYNAETRREQAKRLKSEQVASAGASGVQLDGSVLEVIKQTDTDAEMDAMNIIYGGEVDSANIRNQARQKRKGQYIDVAMQVLGGNTNFGSGGNNKTLQSTSSSRNVTYNYKGNGLGKGQGYS